ncbi:MAG TPA: FAD-dependent oxidoreductase [Pyrinomonadaceae bacterium]|nr:FAD-dependent oxidoreductase [Pyrinomonadaceae bacterium]
MARTRITILGAGPAGVGAAWQLAKQKKADVTVLEQRGAVGGNAGSFEIAGLRVDFGSHRLHPACDPAILKDLKELLGDDLLDRPRHGRIRLQGRWIHFPLKPQDLVLKLPPSFGAGVAMDAARRLLPKSKNGNGHETFTSVLEKGLGRTICRDFYFPYAEKIWGMAPETLSATQAHRRVSAGSLGKMAGKVLSVVPGFKKPGAERFYYPKKGYGQITEALADAARSNGVSLEINSAVEKIEFADKKSFVTYKQGGELKTVEADHVWSTIPLTVLAKIVKPAAPAEVIEASKNISYRAMILIYLVVEQDQWTPYDAHYFPEADIKLTRLSEPKNYSAAGEPQGRTVLCGELPCTVGDDIWNAPDETLGDLVRESLTRCGLPINSPVSQVATRRLAYAYPIYQEGYEPFFEAQDKWADGLEGILTFGRQGLFAHDNTHHALAMAYGAVDCLDDNGNFDKQRWHDYRKEFAKHVVED